METNEDETIGCFGLFGVFGLFGEAPVTTVYSGELLTRNRGVFGGGEASAFIVVRCSRFPNSEDGNYRRTWTKTVAMFVIEVKNGNRVIKIKSWS